MAKSPPRNKSKRTKPAVVKPQSTELPPTNIAVLNDYPDLAKAEAKRKSIKNRQSQIFRRNMWYGLVGVALIASAYSLVALPEWQLKTRNQVEVKGNQLIPTSMLRNIVKIKFPQSIFSVNPKEVAEHLQKASPVTQVRVTKSLFPAKITINLVERKPVARIMIGKDLQLIDAEGTLLPYHFYAKSARDLKLLLKVDQPNHIREHWRYIFREVSAPDLGITLVDWRDPSNLILVNSTFNAHCGFYVLSKFEQQVQKLRQFQVPLVKNKLSQRQPALVHRINLSNPNSPFLF